jgi:hypothetical protein
MSEPLLDLGVVRFWMSLLPLCAWGTVRLSRGNHALVGFLAVVFPFFAVAGMGARRFRFGGASLTRVRRRLLDLA